MKHTSLHTKTESNCKQLLPSGYSTCTYLHIHGWHRWQNFTRCIEVVWKLLRVSSFLDDFSSFRLWHLWVLSMWDSSIDAVMHRWSHAFQTPWKCGPPLPHSHFCGIQCPTIHSIFTLLQFLSVRDLHEKKTTKIFFLMKTTRPNKKKTICKALIGL